MPLALDRRLIHFLFLKGSHVSELIKLHFDIGDLSSDVCMYNVHVTCFIFKLKTVLFRMNTCKRPETINYNEVGILRAGMWPCHGQMALLNKHFPDYLHPQALFCLNEC